MFFSRTMFSSKLRRAFGLFACWLLCQWLLREDKSAIWMSLILAVHTLRSATRSTHRKIRLLRQSRAPKTDWSPQLSTSALMLLTRVFSWPRRWSPWFFCSSFVSGCSHDIVSYLFIRCVANVHRLGNVGRMLNCFLLRGVSGQTHSALRSVSYPSVTSLWSGDERFRHRSGYSSRAYL